VITNAQGLALSITKQA